MLDIISVITNFIFLIICFSVLLRVESKKAPIFSGGLFVVFIVARRLTYDLFLGIDKGVSIASIIILLLISIFFSWLLKEFKQLFGWALIIVLIIWALAPLK